MFLTYIVLLPVPYKLIQVQTGMKQLKTCLGFDYSNHTVTRILMSAFEIQNELFKGCDYVDTFLQKPVLINDLITDIRMLTTNAKSMQAQILAREF